MGLFIPQKLKVGFVKRHDTFNGKLAYVIYYDEKGKLRKEKSFDSWRDKSIEVVEVDNTPASFVLNKGITRTSYDWRNHSRTMIRIWDNRDFEFEISVDNLMGILMHSDVSKRDIQEQCVYAWDGTELVLLPVNSEAYQEAVAHTQKQAMKLTAKDLVPGMKYSFKNDEYTALYLGKYDFSETYYKSTPEYKGVQHVFYNPDKQWGSKFFHANPDALAECASAEVEKDFPEVLQQFMESKEYTASATSTKITASRMAKDAKHGYLCVSKFNEAYLKLTLPDTETVTGKQLLQECSAVYELKNNSMEWLSVEMLLKMLRKNNYPVNTVLPDFNQVVTAARKQTSGSYNKVDMETISPEDILDENLHIGVDYYFKRHFVYTMLLQLKSLNPDYTNAFAYDLWKSLHEPIPVETVRQFLINNKFKTIKVVSTNQTTIL